MDPDRQISRYPEINAHSDSISIYQIALGHYLVLSGLGQATIRPILGLSDSTMSQVARKCARAVLAALLCHSLHFRHRGQSATKNPQTIIWGDPRKKCLRTKHFLFKCAPDFLLWNLNMYEVLRIRFFSAKKNWSDRISLHDSERTWTAPPAPAPLKCVSFHIYL